MLGTFPETGFKGATMENSVILTLLIRGGLAAFFALVGGWCIFLGYRLLFRKAPDRSKSAFEATIGGYKISFSAGAAGTAVVFTSAIWVVSAVVTAPTLKVPGGITVALGPEVTHSTGVESVAALKFQGDRVSLTAEQKTSLDAFLSQLRITATTPKLVVEGYAEVGQPELNVAIAVQRAEAVRDYIVQQHRIDPKQILTYSYSEIRPSVEANKNAVVLTATRKEEGD